MRYFEDSLAKILLEAEHQQYRSAVGIVQYRNKWLLGLSTAKDDRYKKWCFPGGHIKRGESPKQAVVREVYEETGIRCRVVGEAIKKSTNGVIFFHCEVSVNSEKLRLSNEFYSLGWFRLSDLNGLKLYHNVRELINKAK